MSGMAGNDAFDGIVERHGSNSVKWDADPGFEAPPGLPLLPMWVADMDFPAPPCIREAVERRASHAVYGYPIKNDEWYEAFTSWMAARHGWTSERAHILFTPGVVPAIAASILAFTKAGEGVVIQPPVYHPFKALVLANGRRLLENPLVELDGRWRMDLEGLDALCAREKPRLLVFCSPHNPVARVWERDELEALAALAQRHELIIFSDEIHSDLVFAPARHLPLASLGRDIAGRCVSAYAPSKTWNVAGFQTSYAVAANPDLRSLLQRSIEGLGLATPNCFGPEVAAAAYRHGGPWLERLLAYLRGNYETLVAGLAKTAPLIGVAPLEGTYLAWLDFRRSGLAGNLHELLVRRSGLWLDSGARFGTGGEGFARMNLACPRARVEEAVERLGRLFADT